MGTFCKMKCCMMLYFIRVCIFSSVDADEMGHLQATSIHVQRVILHNFRKILNLFRQKQSDLGLHRFDTAFLSKTNVQNSNFIFTVVIGT